MTNVYVLGISLGSDTGAALVSAKHGLICATNEERYNRQKQTKQFPVQSIRHVCKFIPDDAVDLHVVYTHYEDLSFYNLVKYNKSLLESLNLEWAENYLSVYSALEDNETLITYSYNAEEFKRKADNLLYLTQK
jgi:predicted NodU family carbamoyl transferase